MCAASRLLGVVKGSAYTKCSTSGLWARSGLPMPVSSRSRNGLGESGPAGLMAGDAVGEKTSLWSDILIWPTGLMMEMW